jgi:hypothetical protein
MHAACRSIGFNGIFGLVTANFTLASNDAETTGGSCGSSPRNPEMAKGACSN